MAFEGPHSHDKIVYYDQTTALAEAMVGKFWPTEPSHGDLRENPPPPVFDIPPPPPLPSASSSSKEQDLLSECSKDFKYSQDENSCHVILTSTFDYSSSSNDVGMYGSLWSSWMLASVLVALVTIPLVLLTMFIIWRRRKNRQGFSIMMFNKSKSNTNGFPDSVARNVKKSESEKYFILDDFNINTFMSSAINQNESSQTYLQNQTCDDDPNVPIYEEFPEQEPSPFYISNQDQYKTCNNFISSHQGRPSLPALLHPIVPIDPSPLQQRSFQQSPLLPLTSIRENITQEENNARIGFFGGITSSSSPSNFFQSDPRSKGPLLFKRDKKKKGDWNFESHATSNFLTQSPSKRRKIHSSESPQLFDVMMTSRHKRPINSEASNPLRSSTPLTLGCSLNSLNQFQTPTRSSKSNNGGGQMPDPDEILPLQAWTDFSGKEDWSETLSMTYRKKKKKARGCDKVSNENGGVDLSLSEPGSSEATTKPPSSFSSSSNDSSVQR